MNMELTTAIYWTVFAFIIFGIGCLIDYLTSPKQWHEAVAASAFWTVIAAAIFCVAALNWSIGI